MAPPTTLPIRDLVATALESIPRPYSEDLIDDVFLTIQQAPTLLAEYQRLNAHYGRQRLNTMVGKWTGKLVERRGERQVPRKRNTLADSYSILDRPAPPRQTRKQIEHAAREEVFTFFKAHKAALPEAMPRHRDELVRRVMEGDLVEDAFFAFMETRGWDTQALLNSMASAAAPQARVGDGARE